MVGRGERGLDPSCLFVGLFLLSPLHSRGNFHQPVLCCAVLVYLPHSLFCGCWGCFSSQTDRQTDSRVCSCTYYCVFIRTAHLPFPFGIIVNHDSVLGGQGQGRGVLSLGGVCEVG